MRAFLIGLILLTCWPMPVRAEGPGAAPLRHIVWDLDWTLLDPEVPGTKIDPSRTIQVGGERYRLVDWVREGLTKLANRPGVKLSFFSGGTALRNVDALKAIPLTDGSGRSLYDVAYRVLSIDDLTPVPHPPQAKFSERQKKDISKVSSDLANTVLVEDTEHFAMPNQRANTLWVQQTYNVYETYPEARAAREAGTDPRYVPESAVEWYRNRNRIAGAFEILNEALDESDAGKVGFAEAMRRRADQPRASYIQRGVGCLRGLLDRAR
jgi:hypothetical protein